MQKFVNKIRQNRLRVISEFTKIKSKGKSIACYGAPAKATTLFYYFGIAEMVDFIVDDAPLKQGKFMPGSHIPILSAEELFKRKPGYLFILAWNFKDPIIKKVKEKGYRGKFILPFKV